MQSPKNGRTILIADDELEVRAYFELALKCMGYGVELAQDGDEALACLRTSEHSIAAVLLDIMMPGRDGLDTLREIRALNPNLPVIVVSGASSTLNVVAAMKSGATDFLCKPVAHEDLRKAVLRALELKLVEPSAPPCKQNPATAVFAGANPRMREIQAMVAQIGWSEAPVLVQGETGSGKEVLARELHAQSPRANKPFFKLNCAALPSELVESELFGYERGAFTGAFQKKAGMFELADGGTMLLDEIGDMDVRLQAKLLQVLQDHEFQRVGGKETIRVNVRVIAATHQDLEKAIRDRTFREDLYYRLNVIRLHLPPIRDRKEDILPLAEFLMGRHATPGVPLPTMTADLKRAMLAHHWPGNVRELENFVRRFLILRDSEMLARELHENAARRYVTAAADIRAMPADRQANPTILEQVTNVKQQAEKEAILAALSATRWNRKQAAALLRIDYKALLYKMKKLDVDDRPALFAVDSESCQAAGMAASLGG